MPKFIATIHVLVEAGDPDAAADLISETMRSLCFDPETDFWDWEYMRMNRQFLHPVEWNGPVPMDVNERED